MKYSENAINILTAKSYKGIGNAWIVRNLKGNESIDSIVSLICKKTQISIEDFRNRKNHFEKLIQKLEDSCDGIVALGDQNFPHYRGNVKESEQPIFLYYKGNIELLSIENKNICIIGLLKPESNIEERERKLVTEFVMNGATIISGLAFGCDSISHRQTLESNGKTIAILPSPLNNIIPSQNKGLAEEIVKRGGLLVSEYGNNFKSTNELNSRYKERDRLQALFCDTIILAASYSKDSSQYWIHLIGQKLDSGARLAMEYAKNYNIPRAVMYDESFDLNNPMFDLNRQLIKEQINITTINQTNLSEVVKKIMNKKDDKRNGTYFQTSLFSSNEE